MYRRKRHLVRRQMFEQYEARLCLSTIGFASHDIECCSIGRANSISMADLDGDGDLDVLSLSSQGEASFPTIAWYENTNGQGTFGTQQVIAVGRPSIFHDFSSQSVAAGDLDGDGDLDVVVPPISREAFTWYENMDGQGTFGSQHVITTEVDRTNYSVTTGDLDGDGDRDVLIAFFDKITWHENIDGQGTFSKQRVISNKGGKTVTTGDLDNDGDLDVLSDSEWYENVDGQGSFGPQQMISTEVSRVQSITMADLDSDGDLDVLSASTRFPSGDSKITWHENTDGQGSFGPRQVIITEVNRVQSVTTADLDGDGDMDVLSASSEKIAWHKNLDGQGSFDPQQVITTEVNRVQSITTSDLDGDGDLDVLSGSYEKIAWYENLDSQGTFGLQQVITSQALFVRSVTTGDLDSDGDLDVLSASSRFDDGRIAWYENTDGQGTFGPQQVITLEIDGARSVTAADLDGDGDLDVLSASERDDKIAWYKNTDGRGSFGPQQVITAEANRVQSITTADLDGDGDLDVLSASSSKGRVTWHENIDGQGTFSQQRVISNIGRGTVATGDLDNDGDLDVLSGSVWYENIDGQGTFGPQQGIAGGSVTWGDLDGDGDLDVLSGSTTFPSGDSKIAWHENTDGQGNFGPRQVIITEVNRLQSITTADVDGDGDLDALSASGLDVDDKIAWYENLDGQGTFGAQQVITAEANRVQSITTADLDGDGDLDVLSASSDNGRITWHEQRLVGDTNDDGVFNSSDLVDIFQSGEYEDEIPGNSTFDEGDWNGDGEFDSSDLVRAFQAGHYESAGNPLQSQIAAAVTDRIFAADNGRKPSAYIA